MTPKQRMLWEVTDLEKHESSMSLAHQKVSECARKAIDPTLFKSLALLKKKVRAEVKRLGGDWKESERSVTNMFDNLERVILSSVIPNEVVELKYPPGID